MPSVKDIRFGHLPWYARDWGFYKNEKAIAHMPILSTPEQVRSTCSRFGMSESHPAPGVERWDHFDGSFVQMVYGQPRPQLGCKLEGVDYPLGRLPYNNRTG